MSARKVDWGAVEGEEQATKPEASGRPPERAHVASKADLRVLDKAFLALTGNRPFPWQAALYQRFLAGNLPRVCNIPTGLGKTSVIAVWLLARAAGAALPRRLVYVVNRRTVVDQTTDEVERIRANLAAAGIEEPLVVSTLRGQMADNRAWSADPSRQAVVCGTVDMIGSRLLFGGYRIGFRARPLHAGLLGQDALIVHDEAHLEPAFQQLLEAIQDEQERQGDRWPMRVMALTATSRDGDAAFGLEGRDEAHPVVAQRIHATKRLTLHRHGDRDLVERVVAQTLSYEGPGSAVLVFLRSVEDVSGAVRRLRNAKVSVQHLTGTMRGLERDRLAATDPIFRRFLAGSAVSPSSPFVVLVCTSAGEVGVNLSADHLVCDLSTFDSMAQRFGRVNRLGLRQDSEIHVFHQEAEELDAGDPLDARRIATLRLLRSLHGDASPAALARLAPEARRAAFAPEPTILEPSEILFDAWSMTTVEDLPGRPPLAPYLHGVADWEPPTTHVAWRSEVDLLTSELLERHPARELIDDYPIKPHELLADRTSRVLTTLLQALEHDPEAGKSPVWIVRESGRVEATILGELCAGDRKSNERSLAGCTLLLSPRWSRPVDGLLAPEGWGPGDESADVADVWLGEKGEPLRRRLLCGPPPAGMKLVRSILLGDDEEREGDEPPRRWSWYELPVAADEGSGTAALPVALGDHLDDVEREATRIVSRLSLDPCVGRAVTTAARFHDLGKRRRAWQRSIGNLHPDRILAKSGGAMTPIDVTPFRHEYGSIIDLEREGLLAQLPPDEQDLVLHLVAAHHGRARPHFPPGELFDPERPGADARELGVRVVTRYALLQRRFGRWGLAYLESLVRAADWAASAKPSKFVEASP